MKDLSSNQKNFLGISNNDKIITPNKFNDQNQIQQNNNYGFNHQNEKKNKKELLNINSKSNQNNQKYNKQINNKNDFNHIISYNDNVSNAGNQQNRLNEFREQYNKEFNPEFQNFGNNKSKLYNYNNKIDIISDLYNDSNSYREKKGDIKPAKINIHKSDIFMNAQNNHILNSNFDNYNNNENRGYSKNNFEQDIKNNLPKSSNKKQYLGLPKRIKKNY